LQVKWPEEPKKVGDVRFHHEMFDYLHVLPYPLRRFEGVVQLDDIAGGEEAARYEVEHSGVQRLANIYLLPGAPVEIAHQVLHLVLADTAQRGEAARGDDVRGHKAALRLPPRVGALGSQSKDRSAHSSARTASVTLRAAWRRSCIVNASFAASVEETTTAMLPGPIVRCMTGP
jgi:hypothetical protein